MLSALKRHSLPFRLGQAYVVRSITSNKLHQPTTKKHPRILCERVHQLRSYETPAASDICKTVPIRKMSSTLSSINLPALGNNFVKKVPTMEKVKLESLWQESTTVVLFLRRFGCVFCRQSAMEISKLLPVLKKNNVRLLAVGLEDFGHEEFVQGNYFKGDLYIDVDEASYKEIGYKKYSTFGVLMSLLHKTARDAISKSRSDGLPGNLAGNGLQTGGTIIVNDGGTKILMDYRQTNPADHVANSEILKALGITEADDVVIDAWGKIPSGILYGNAYELGQFDECLSVERAANDQDTNVLKGQYCVTQLSIESVAQTSRVFDEISDKRQLKKENNFKGNGARLMPTQGAQSLGLNVGICVPDSCSPERLTQILNYALNVSNVSAMALVSADFCHTNVKADLGSLDIFTIAFFGIIALLMLASTIYDVLMTQNKKHKRIGLTAFSVYSNAQKIFHCNESTSQDAIDCLNGIRVLSIVWVIFGHAHMIFVMGPLLNPGYILQWMKQLYSMLLISATVSVDSFFLLSGFLVAWSSLRHLDKSNGKLNIFLFYFHRYIRLTPPLAALVLLSSSLMRHVGSGPLWKIFLNVADKPCQEYWWSALLYVQNYVNPSEICLGHSWYLSVDTQLFILSPLIVYPLWRWRRKFVWIIPILISLSMGCVFSIFMIFHYSAQAMRQMTGGGSMIKTYYPTHTRMGAWLVGVLLGYTLHNLKGKSVRLPKILIAIGWSIAVGTILSIIFGAYFMQQPDYKATDLESAFYESFSRVCWAISLSWMVFACVHGYGGPVNWFLSLPQWQPLARLSYSIYLVHLPIQLLLAASSRTQLNFNDYTAIHKFWGDFGLTLTVSLFWTLAFESPIVVFEKLMFSERTVAATVSNEHLVRNTNFNSTEAVGPTEIHSSPLSPSKV